MQKSKQIALKVFNDIQTRGDLELFMYHAYKIHFENRYKKQGILQPPSGYYHKYVQYSSVPVKYQDELGDLMIDHIIMIDSLIGVGVGSRAKKVITEGEPIGLKVDVPLETSNTEQKDVQPYIEYYASRDTSYFDHRQHRPLFREEVLACIEKGTMKHEEDNGVQVSYLDEIGNDHVVKRYSTISSLSDIINYITVKYNDYLTLVMDIPKKEAKEVYVYSNPFTARRYVKSVYVSRIKDLAYIIKNIKSKEITVPGDGTGIATIIGSMLGKKVYSGDSSVVMVDMCKELGINIEYEDSQKTIDRGKGPVLVSHIMEFTPNLIHYNRDRDFIVYEQHRIYKGCVGLLDVPGKQGYLRVSRYTLMRNVPFVLSLEDRVQDKTIIVPLKIIASYRTIGFIGSGSYGALRYIKSITDILPRVSIIDTNTRADVITSYIKDMGYNDIGFEDVECVVVYDWSMGDYVYNCPYHYVYDGKTYECHNNISNKQLYYCYSFSGAGIASRDIDRKGKSVHTQLRTHQKLFYGGEIIISPRDSRKVKGGHINTLSGRVSYIIFKYSGTYKIQLKNSGNDAQEEIDTMIFGKYAGVCNVVTVDVEENIQAKKKRDYKEQNRVNTLTYKGSFNRMATQTTLDERHAPDK